MEMKDDIAGKPREAQFHKIYIQQHDNVRLVLCIDATNNKNIFSFSLFLPICRHAVSRTLVKYVVWRRPPCFMHTLSPFLLRLTT